MATDEQPRLVPAEEAAHPVHRRAYQPAGCAVHMPAVPNPRGAHHMTEVERYEGTLPMRVVVLQGKHHGPVYVKAPGLIRAKCVEPGCRWEGFDRVGPDGPANMEADAQLHLQDVADKEGTP